MRSVYMHFPRRRSLLLEVPQSWNELSAAQVIRIAEILSAEQDVHTTDIKLVQTITGLDSRRMAAIDPAIMVEWMIPLVDFIKTGCSLTKQLFPSVPVGFLKNLYGPADELMNVRFAEFDFAERDLHAWHLDMNDHQALYRFVACLYRPKVRGYDFRKNPEGDCRQEFNYNLSVHYVQLLQEHLPVSQAIAIAMWYKGCRQLIIERFPDVFDCANQSEDPAQPAYFGLIRAIAKEGTYGTFPDVERLFLYTALLEISSAIQDQKRQQEAIDQLKSQD